MNKKLNGTTTVRVQRVLYRRAKRIGARDSVWKSAEKVVNACLAYGLKHASEVIQEYFQ